MRDSADRINAKRARAKTARPTHAGSLPKSPPGGRSSKRREQLRSIETRIAILNAALAEFAEKGFEAASTRDIGDRCGLHFSLIRYHFKTKAELWKATATHFFEEILAGWEREHPGPAESDPISGIRREFHAFLKFTMEYPDFHQFMLHENRRGSPRFTWLMKNLLEPLIKRVLVQIKAAQDAGDLPPGNPVLLYYLVLGASAALSSMGPEIRYYSGLRTDDPAVIESFWQLIDKVIFKRPLY